MKYPTMVFKHPGKHPMHGGLFDYKIVDADEVDAACADGWHRSTPEALRASCNDDIPRGKKAKKVVKKSEVEQVLEPEAPQE